MAKGTKRSKTLHNPTFPDMMNCGNQKQLRSKNVTSAASQSTGNLILRFPKSIIDGGIDNKGDELPSSSTPPPRWNLRSNGAATIADGVSENGNGEKLQAKSKVPLEKARKYGITVTLSNSEIEEDYMRMLGRRPPRRPKNKRPKQLQKTLDTLYPGLCLEDISLDLYKVSKSRENGKR